MPLFTEVPRREIPGCPLTQWARRRKPRLLHPGQDWLRRSLLVRYLKECDFVAFYVRYRLVTGFRRLLAQPICLLLAGAHRFFALPQGNAEHRAALAVTQGDEPL